MPLHKTNKGWMWGSKGPFPTKGKALAVARAAYASGYKELDKARQIEIMESSSARTTRQHEANFSCVQPERD